MPMPNTQGFPQQAPNIPQQPPQPEPPKKKGWGLL
jgi:hypothetical protein